EKGRGPAAPGEGLVTLRRKADGGEEGPCFLYLQCDPRGYEEIVSLWIVSEARNMEVYAGEEYRGTSRGESVCTVPDDSGNGVITLYKKHLKLEDPTDACKIKLLSFGEKQSVSISKIQVQLRRVSADSSTSSPTLGSRIDLDRVQAMMESMGSKLSPGAQQLMNMIRFQQRNCVPFGEQLPSVLGKKEPDPFGDPEMRDGLQRRSSPMGDSDKMSVRHSPFKSSLTPGAVTEAFKTYFERHPQQFAGDCTEGPEILPPNSVCPQNDIKVVSALLQKKANANLPCLELLPFFQNLCSQVNHLRRGDKTKPQENCPKPSKEGSVNTGDEQQPVCSYLEKIISKNMELMEKKLMDYIDQRLYRLQEHIDEKVILLMDRLQNPSFTATRLTQGDYDSGERLSNGDR
ncbi:ATPase PAAT, partial [Ornithorhynchus anatinus]